MSVEARRWHVVLVLMLAGTATAQAPADAPQADAPDLALLEYLGRWEESDQDWLLVAGLEEDEQAPATATEHEDDDTATDANAVAEQDDEE